MRVVPMIAGLTLSTVAIGAPFTWDPTFSEAWIGGFGFGGALAGQPYTSFFSYITGGGGGGAFCGGTLTFNEAGVYFAPSSMHTYWFQANSPSQVFAWGKFKFTPTVPNLSYSFGGHLDVFVTGSAARYSTCAVELHPNYPHPPSLYSNNQYFTSGAELWYPAANQVGAPSGDLIQGLEYIMTWDLRIHMTVDTDESARYEAITSGGPNFLFQLYQRPCDGDLNGDGYVDDSDFVGFAAAYDLLDCADPLMPPGCPCDINHDGVVDDDDFILFAVAYENFVCP